MKTKTKIIKAFLELNKSMTIKEISKSIKADYRITHTATQRLIQENILLPQKIGSSILCQLHPEYYGREIYLAEEEKKRELFQDKNMKQLYKDIISKINKSLFVLLLIPQSSPIINLLFISNESDFKERIKKVLDTIPLNINAKVMREDEFIKLKYSREVNRDREIDREHNLVKRALQNSIILHNIDSFYLMKRL